MTRVAHSRLCEVLRYDPATGEFLWLVGQLAGRRAGTKATKTCTYRKIMVDGVRYLEHVLAWFYMTKAWPADCGMEVDHRDWNRSNNKWSNLQLLTPTANRLRHQGYKGNPFTGASFSSRNGKWAASIRINGRETWLGYHDTAEAAHEAWRTAVRKRPENLRN